MLEKWVQITCDGCGETTDDGDPHGTGKKFRKYLKDSCGWVSFGRLDYCPTCIKFGRDKTKSEEMVPHCTAFDLYYPK